MNWDRARRQVEQMTVQGEGEVGKLPTMISRFINGQHDHSLASFRGVYGSRQGRGRSVGQGVGNRMYRPHWTFFHSTVCCLDLRSERRRRSGVLASWSTVLTGQL